MKTIAAVLLAVFALSGCSVIQKMRGKWHEQKVDENLKTEERIGPRR